MPRIFISGITLLNDHLAHVLNIQEKNIFFTPVLRERSLFSGTKNAFFPKVAINISQRAACFVFTATKFQWTHTHTQFGMSRSLSVRVVLRSISVQIHCVLVCVSQAGTLNISVPTTDHKPYRTHRTVNCVSVCPLLCCRCKNKTCGSK